MQKLRCNSKIHSFWRGSYRTSGGGTVSFVLPGAYVFKFQMNYLTEGNSNQTNFTTQIKNLNVLQGQRRCQTNVLQRPYETGAVPAPKYWGGQ